LETVKAENMTNIGDLVRNARLAAGMTQSVLSGAASVTLNYISLVENGHRKPSLSFLQRVADATGLDLNLTLAASPD
jgi:transcriptional regulator with XRE-family HTH domain